MIHRPSKWLTASLGLLLAAGCYYPVREKIDATVCDLAARPRDLQPLTGADQTPPPAEGVALAAYSEPQQPPSALKGDRLQIPPALLPAGPVPKISVPIDEKDPLYPKRKEIIDALYPPLEAPGEEARPLPGPNGRPLTLADLQRLGLSNSPLVLQAVANVEAARGGAIQAGLYPNPSGGFQQDTAGTAGGPAYLGFFLNQVIKTGNKLQLQRASAVMDLRNAELARRRAETDLAAQVRGGYFAVLVARENVRVSRALVDFTDQVYRIQVENVRKGGFAAAYEPMQLRVFALQAQASLIQARNRQTSAWKQLAAAMGLPGMPPTELAGRIDVAIPVFNHEAVLARALQSHTDVLTADNTLLKAKYQLQLARVTPVPDVTVNVVVQKDYTGPPFNVVYSLQAGVPIPIFDRNQGAILQAQAMVVQSSEEADRVRSALTTRLADAFERYDNNRRLLHIYRDQILPDQVRAYRATYDRFQKEGPPGAAFADVVVAQQALATSVTTYVATLGTMWQAVVDVADVLQTDDLFQVAQDGPPDLACPVPDLRTLAPLPCRHPCSPLPDPALKGAHGDWPAPAAEPIAPPAYKPQPEPAKPKRAKRKPKPAPQPAPEPAAEQEPEAPPAPTNPAADPLLEPPPDVPSVGKAAPSALP